MFRQLLKLRYLATVIVILAVLHAVAFLVMGARIAFRAYWHVLDETVAAGTRPGVELLHSLDFLFVSLVLLVLGLGIAKLFVVNLTRRRPPRFRPGCGSRASLSSRCFSGRRS